MDVIVDQEPNNYKHFCKICKKGFVCGRALGGHMRAHGIGDESGVLDDDDQASDWEDKGGGGGSNTPPSNKRMYALRTNPNRLRSCRICENCGKEFLSWKSFLEHGKCSSDDAESLVSSPGSDGEDGGGRRSSGWSKRKRSFRTKVESFNTNNCPSTEDEELANCLMMLSNATVDPLMVDQPEESSFTSAMKEERRHSMSFIAPIMSRGTPIYSDHKAKGVASPNVGNSNPNSKGLFECKACKKVFNSHQALGGHRASHKKVKGCFAAKLDQDHTYYAEEDNLYIANDQDQEFMRPSKSSCNITSYQLEHGGLSSPVPTMSKRPKSKVHECSICHRIFSSGQALGGHKRCHWITSNAPDASTIARFQELHDQIVQASPLFATHHRTISEEYQATLDLNQPAPNDQDNKNPNLSYEVSTDIILQSWGGVNVEMKNNEIHQNQEGNNYENNEGDHKEGDDKKTNNNQINNNNNIVYESNLANNTDDEADSKVKLAKLCELKDNMTTNGSSSPWLQVGIGSSNAVEAKP